MTSAVYNVYDDRAILNVIVLNFSHINLLCHRDTTRMESAVRVRPLY